MHYICIYLRDNLRRREPRREPDRLRVRAALRPARRRAGSTKQALPLFRREPRARNFPPGLWQTGAPERFRRRIDIFVKLFFYYVRLKKNIFKKKFFF